MRPLRLLSTCLLFATYAAAVQAQDVSYKMTIHSEAPAMGMPMPSNTMTTRVHGSLIRIDTEMGMPEMSSSMIVDVSKSTMTMLMHGQKVYMEVPTSMVWQTMDTKLKGGLAAASPKVTPTGELQVINGYEAQRYIMTMDFPTELPMPGATLKEGMKVVMIADQWLSSDSALNKVQDTMRKMMGSQQSNPFSSLMMNPDLQGFPLKSTMLMVQVPKGSSYDPMFILKAGSAAPNLVMKMDMSFADIQFSPLDPALFSIPPGYTKIAR